MVICYLMFVFYVYCIIILLSFELIVEGFDLVFISVRYYLVVVCFLYGVFLVFVIFVLESFLGSMLIVFFIS